VAIKIDEVKSIEQNARYLRATLLCQDSFQKIAEARSPGHVGAGAVWMGGVGACAALVGIYPRFWVGNKVMFPLLPTSQKCYNTTVPFNGKDTSSKHSS